MDSKKILLTIALCALALPGVASYAETLSFSGYTWVVRPASRGGPGPNNWDPKNAWVDTNGFLHLKLSQHEGKWTCAEVYTQDHLGFGRYQFCVSGPVDKLDRNVVLGLFNYPTSDVGPDGTHEIDIEFAKWGNASVPIGNYTIWPATNSVKRETKSFSFALKGDASTHRFAWDLASVLFQTLQGNRDDDSNLITSWLYKPENPSRHISRKPMPVHINLWCFKGQPPVNGQEVELIVRSFKFTPK